MSNRIRSLLGIAFIVSLATPGTPSAKEARYRSETDEGEQQTSEEEQTSGEEQASEEQASEEQASEEQQSPEEQQTSQLSVKQGLFCASGTFSGVLEGHITLGGVTYEVAPEAAIYEIAKGVAEQGMIVNERAIYVSGKMLGDTPTVFTVIVRPPAKGNLLSSDSSSRVHVLSPGAPQ